MKSDLQKLRDHADAVTALVDETTERTNALIAARETIMQYDQSPMRSATLQYLSKAIVKVQEYAAVLAPYARTLTQYLAEQERK